MLLFGLYKTTYFLSIFRLQSKPMTVGGTKEIGKFIENPHVIIRVVFPLTGIAGSLPNFAFNFRCYSLFIQIEFNWITNKSCLFIYKPYSWQKMAFC